MDKKDSATRWRPQTKEVARWVLLVSWGSVALQSALTEEPGLDVLQVATRVLLAL